MAIFPIITKNDEVKILNGLHSKDSFDNVKSLNRKPSVSAEGFSLKNSDLVITKSDNGRLDSPIISEPPNLYKQTGALMSKIPYLFETPVPKYFRENGWFDCEHTFKFVNWAFSRCSTQTTKRVINLKEIILEPYEFIAGRLTSPKECFLTENIFRNQLISMQKAGFIKKTTNSLTNHYSCYVWVTDRFLQNNNQQNNQPSTNRQPTDNHNPEEEKIRITEKDHPSIPSFENEGNRDGKIDDLFSKEENKNKIHIYSGKYHNNNALHVYLTQNELNECLKVRGTKEQIINIIEVVANWKQRKYEIKDWFKTILTWNHKSTVGDKIIENEKIGNKIQDYYAECIGWRAYTHCDKNKDVRGTLFESTSSAGNPIPIFIPFSDPEYKKKCLEIIELKKMTKKGM